MSKLRMPWRTPSKDAVAVSAIVIAVIAFILTPLAAWMTHVIVCIKASAWILLAFGCIVAPVGVLHGIGIWLGIFP